MGNRPSVSEPPGALFSSCYQLRGVMGLSHMYDWLLDIPGFAMCELRSQDKIEFLSFR